MKEKMKFGIIISIFIIFFGSKAKSQQVDCPPNQEWEIETRTLVEFYPYFILGGLDDFEAIKARRTDDGYEIKVDWSSLYVGGMGGLFRLTKEEVKQMMYKAIIIHFTERNCSGMGDPNEMRFVFYEETECKQLKHCYLRVKKEQRVFCTDEGWPGPDPEFLNYQGEEFYNVRKLVTCGKQCCQYIFIVDRGVDEHGSRYPRIKSFTKIPNPGSNCPPSTDVDCLKGEPEPCSSTCE